MAPDTEQEVIRINLKMLASLIGLAAVFITGIAWGVRLEYRTETNAGEAVKLAALVEVVRNDARVDHDKVTRHDTQVASILIGIEEIKSLLKDRK